MATTWEIAEKIRTPYLDFYYNKVLPLANDTALLSGFNIEQTKAFDALIKQLDMASKKMDEAEAKLQILAEATGKLLATNNDAALVSLDTDLKTQLIEVGKMSEHRKLVQIYGQKVHLKQIDTDFGQASQQITQLQADTDKNIKLNEIRIKEALKESAEAVEWKAKGDFQMAKAAISITAGSVPTDGEYEDLVINITEQIQKV